MRKRLINSTPASIPTRGEGWLDIESAAVVEVTSEDPNCPVESAFVLGDARGWRAAAPGSAGMRLQWRFLPAACGRERTKSHVRKSQIAETMPARRPRTNKAGKKVRMQEYAEAFAVANASCSKERHSASLMNFRNFKKS
jgi:hypothetical protein